MLESNLIKMKNPLNKFSELEQVWPLDDAFILPKSAKNAFCERYGGAGVGLHGGGARSANVSHYQIKGIGITPIAGEASNPNYSHGTLNLVDASYETIYSKLLNNILPVGAIFSLAVFHTGRDMSFNFRKASFGELEKNHGALLVRPPCERVAHFLRSGGYSVPKEYRYQICSDVERIRNVVKEFHGKYGDSKHLTNVAVEFLTASANQFGFARVCGLMHGAISASNITTSGQWLDLSISTFLDRGKNYIISDSSFYREAEKIQDIAVEWLYTVHKYLGKPLNIYPLINYYQNKLNYFTAFHCSYLVGLPRDNISQCKVSNTYEKLCVELLKICLPKSKICELDELLSGKTDPLVHYLESMSDRMMIDYETAHLKIVIDSFYSDEPSGMKRLPFIRRSFIKAFKRAILREFFFKNQLYDQLDDLAGGDDVEGIGNLISESINLGSWIFDDSFTNTETICKLDDVEIYYNCLEDCYVFRDCDHRVMFNSMSDLVSSKNFSNRNWIHFRYDFSRFINLIASKSLFNGMY